jgi:hypothetical protein
VLGTARMQALWSSRRVTRFVRCCAASLLRTLIIFTVEAVGLCLLAHVYRPVLHIRKAGVRSRSIEAQHWRVVLGLWRNLTPCETGRRG